MPNTNSQGNINADSSDNDSDFDFDPLFSDEEGETGPLICKKETVLLNDLMQKNPDLQAIKATIKALGPGADLEVTNEHGDTLLFIAAQLGYKEIVEELLKHKPKVNAKNYFGRTPLLAVIYQYQYNKEKEKKEVYLNIFEQLLNAEGIDVNIGKGSPDRSRVTVYDTSTEDGETPLYMAAKYGCLELVKMILDKDGVYVDLATKKNGNTPLFIASENGHYDIVETLIAHGADVNAKNRDWKTPLHIASWEKNLNIVKLLVEKGANVNARNQYGSTPSRSATGSTLVYLTEKEKEQQ